MKTLKCEKCENDLYYIEVQKDKTLTRCNNCKHIMVENWL